MPHVIFNINDKEYSLTIKEGHTLLRAAKQGHVPLRHKCGGKASCTTCKVKIYDQTGISPPNHKEQYKLGDKQISDGIRLSCQTRVYKSVEAIIPEDPFRARVRQLLEEQRKND